MAISGIRPIRPIKGRWPILVISPKVMGECLSICCTALLLHTVATQAMTMAILATTLPGSRWHINHYLVVTGMAICEYSETAYYLDNRTIVYVYALTLIKMAKGKSVLVEFKRKIL
jgi:hypothetical protein